MKKWFVKKLDEDDILEILIENFQTGKYGVSQGYANLFGVPGKDLRAVIVINRGPYQKFDLDEIDKNTEYNGDHYFLKQHPEFDLSRYFKKNTKND